ncbi:4-hydroxyphenylacetate 3-hydroxylase N-terminal domain-containing protein [Desulfopila aestuarii]|uniref:4-hydroxybutyryl-CoA dehydratase / vinylacetyl-CoA-Delta-isomerase n=1 Tax=Desulfopila aestuarii DSM 18488 TaxID=1121416 RepID=A0A1M7YG36_9BACT|nr:4-hydroxyphenylacetate 3-hydroxylase N-terminal domain-containing protein [Desulfopila aestuarii]SHO51551.1 4-hydroxybutyryl-CoA dehydratase / vinylacetyl-CoA-Delta-isomerase [Desulfopila aestuarii DSM 18488]
MAIKNRDDYLQALKKMRPNIYKFGERIEDVTTHPATRRTVESHAIAYDGANDPNLQKMFTTTSMFTGEKIHRWNSMMQEEGHLISNMRLKRQNYRRTGTCTGGVCVGWNAQNVMWAVTHEIDEANGTNYQERLKKWILHAEENGLTVAGALTDAKGDRSLSPSKQTEPDTTLHIKEIREDGIIIRGVKAMICSTAAAQEVFLLPGSVYGEDDKNCALSCVVPRDIEGLTVVEATRPSDQREFNESGIQEVPDTGITQGWLLFDDVFVPNDRVFMCHEYQFTSKVITYFTANYRACIGACVAGQGDVMIGASILMARANGLSSKTFMSKLVDMSVNNQVTFGLGAGALAIGKKHPSGTWIADSLTAHTNKVMVATLPYEVKRLTQEIGGGIVETGCMPSSKDLDSPEYGEMLRKVMKAGSCSTEARVKAARLSEWLTLGGGIPGCMHGGGSPDGAKLVVRFTTPMEEYVDYARKIMNIEEEIQDPQKPLKK